MWRRRRIGRTALDIEHPKDASPRASRGRGAESEAYVSELYHSRRTQVRTRRHRRQPSAGRFMEQLENRQLMSLTVDLRLPGGGKSATVKIGEGFPEFG